MHEAFTYQIIQDRPPLEVTALCSYVNLFKKNINCFIFFFF